MHVMFMEMLSLMLKVSLKVTWIYDKREITTLLFVKKEIKKYLSCWKTRRVVK